MCKIRGIKPNSSGVIFIPLLTSSTILFINLDVNLTPADVSAEGVVTSAKAGAGAHQARL